jgi:hypothetical protein
MIALGEKRPNENKTLSQTSSPVFATPLLCLVLADGDLYRSVLPGHPFHHGPSSLTSRPSTPFNPTDNCCARTCHLLDTTERSIHATMKS